MPFKEFAQTFIDAYHIPRLDPMANMGGQYFGYKDDAQGWMVFVYPNNSFAVETAQTEAHSSNQIGWRDRTIRSSAALEVMADT